MSLRIGLTGGIGSGKSTVAALLVARGAVLLDTDAIARRLTAPGGAAVAAIADAFGTEVIDASGGLDRERMRAAAFADATQRQRLEAILHPLIGVAVDVKAGAAPVDAPALLFDVPLLVESARWRPRVDRVWVIDCSEDEQVRRVVARSAWSEAAVRAVIAQQATRSARRAAADAVVFNDGIGAEALAAEVDALWTATLAARP